MAAVILRRIALREGEHLRSLTGPTAGSFSYDVVV
jgi:hypothetical protein